MSPERIKKAKVEGDTDFLSEAGRRGAEVVKKNRERERIEDEIFAKLADEAATLEEVDRMRATNEDILTPDGEDPYEKD